MYRSEVAYRSPMSILLLLVDTSSPPLGRTQNTPNNKHTYIHNKQHKHMTLNDFYCFSNDFFVLILIL